MSLRLKPCFLPAVLISCLLASQAYAISQAAVLFLLISPSPQANGMGQTYGATAYNDPMAMIMNPGALGFYAQRHQAGLSFYPEAIDWLPGFGNATDGMGYSAMAVTAGLNLEKQTGMPLSVGLGLHRVKLDLGTMANTGSNSPEVLSTHEVWDEVKGITLSGALDYGVRISFGWTFKAIESNRAPISGDSVFKENPVGVNAHDLGLMVQLPVFELLGGRPEYAFGRGKVTPFLEPGFYWSLNNIGSKIEYIEEQADPLPRYCTLGLNLAVGLSCQSDDYRFTLCSFRWAGEAGEMLVSGRDYLSTPQNISLWTHVLGGKSDNGVISRGGFELNLADCVFIRGGQYKDQRGYVNLDTEGFGINFLQPLKLLAAAGQLNNDSFVRILSHFDFEMNQAEYKLPSGHPLHDTKFKGFVLRFHSR